MLTFEYGENEYEKGNYQEAFKVFMILAARGDIKAQISIACMYESGIGIQQNFNESVKWYRQAAEQGHPLAQNNLAVILLNIDPKEAIQWLFAAAENNFPFAQSMLGDICYGLYYLPTDIQENMKNIDNAIEWYKRAGTNGFYSAFHELGEIFAAGQGVEKDEMQALEYYFKAADNGYSPSQEILGRAYMDALLGLPIDLQQSQYWFAKARQGQE